jgi:chemotaxis protein MotB
MVGRGKRAASQEEGGGVPGWMVTYGDMMSLLLCFFVLILSFSSVEISKFKKAMGSLRGALGIMPTDTGSSTSRSFPQSMQNAKAIEALEDMEETFRKLDVTDDVQWEVTPEGVHIVMNDPVMFDLGKADLKPDVFPILQAIVKVIDAENPEDIEVQGHTDDLPIHTSQFPSNWELSAARALNVVKYFAYKGDIPPRKLSAIGYGEYRPAYINTDRDRSKNRRVEIFLKKKIAYE